MARKGSHESLRYLQSLDAAPSKVEKENSPAGQQSFASVKYDGLYPPSALYIRQDSQPRQGTRIMGMPNIVFRCQMFRGDWDQVWSQMRMLWLMEGLCRVNQTHLRQFDEFKKRGLVENGYPTVYGSGLHYETEKGTEIWPDIPSLLMGTMGKGVYPGPWGDCEDLACYRVGGAARAALALRADRPLEAKKDDGKPNIEMADPRFPQGDAERAASAAKQGLARVEEGQGGDPRQALRQVAARPPGATTTTMPSCSCPTAAWRTPRWCSAWAGRRSSPGRHGREAQERRVPVVIQFAKPPTSWWWTPRSPRATTAAWPSSSTRTCSPSWRRRPIWRAEIRRREPTSRIHVFPPCPACPAIGGGKMRRLLFITLCRRSVHDQFSFKS